MEGNQLGDLCEDGSGAIILKCKFKSVVWGHGLPSADSEQEPGLGGLLSTVTGGELLEKLTDS